MSDPSELLRLFADHPDDMLEYGEHHLNQRGNHIIRQLTLIENLVGFVETLRTHEAMTRHQIEYNFDGASIDPDIFPTAISDYIMADELNHVAITVTHEGETCTGFGIAISAGNREVVLSRDPSVDDTAERDVVFIDTIKHHMERVGKADMNRLIVGLVTGEPVDRDIDMNDVRLYAPESIENLQHAIERVSPHTVEDASHEFESGRYVSFRQEQYNGGGNRIEEIALHYETGNPDRRIRCVIDLSNGLNLTFSSIDKLDGIKPFTPNANDVERLLDVTAELKSATEVLTIDSTESMQPITLEEADNERIRQSQIRTHRYGEGAPGIDSDQEDPLGDDYLPQEPTER